MLIWNIEALCIKHKLVDAQGRPDSRALSFKVGVWHTTAIQLLSGKQQAVSLDVLARLKQTFEGLDPDFTLNDLFTDNGTAVEQAPKKRKRPLKRVAAEAKPGKK